MVEELRVGAVDLGSNSFHLVVAQESQGRIQVVDRIKERVGLGAGIGPRGKLDEDVAENALRCLERFQERLRAVPPRRIRAVGTRAFRDLRAHPDFLERAEAALGSRIEVVSGEEEARLIYLGVREMQGSAGGKMLAVDIGGGSTEFVVGSAAEPKIAESLSMGSSSYSQRFFPKGELKKSYFTKAILRARNQIKPIRAAFKRYGWERVFGSSGTFLALARILEANGWGMDGLNPHGLAELREELLRFDSMQQVELEGLKEHRRGVLPGGLAIAIAVIEELECERLPVSDAALREGLMVDLLGRLSDRDVRAESVQHLAERFHVDAAQAGRVARTARQVFDAVDKPWGLSLSQEWPFLLWAAQLHEVGLVISHTGFHRHGAYLIEHSDPPGFSRDETRILGELVALQRRRIPSNPVKQLAPAMRASFLRLLMPLRVAVRLHRSRSDEVLPEFRFEATENCLTVVGPIGWREANPLTEDNLLVEARAWRDHPLKLKLEEA
jgi:exopolyphosphatase / guanosine-5'-triphosphate,3'-diphosphate pyrophosphatase